MPLPPVVYTTFSGSIDAQSIARIFTAVGNATQNGVTTVHLLFQSSGGVINDGIALYNFVRGLSIDLHMYNAGAVQSVAFLPFIAAKHRHVSEYGVFFLHKSTFTPQAAATEASQFKALYGSLVGDDARVEAIVKAHTKIPASKFPVRTGRRGITIGAQDAVSFGIADDMCEFTVPSGSQTFNI
jgi:ATP-dependent Clp protease, protease subunit